MAKNAATNGIVPPLSRDDGAGMAEYALLVMLVGVVIAAAFPIFMNSLIAAIQQAETAIGN